MQSFHNELTDKLIDAILNLKTKEECYNFFDDCCTINELLDMSKRFEAAKLLSSGENYQNVIKKLGLSTATLSRVSKALKYGNGYKKVIKKGEK